MNNINTQIIKLNSRVRHRKMGLEGVIVCMHNGEVLVVNEVGSYIIEQLKEPQSYSHVIESICNEFEVSNDSAQLDLDEYLKLLLQQEIVAIEDQNS